MPKVSNLALRLFLTLAAPGLAFGMSSTDALAEADCGPVTRSVLPLPSDARLWQIAGQVVVESRGGLTIGTVGASPTYPFEKTTSESLISIVPAGAAGLYMLFTRQPLGVSVYLWNQSNPAAPSLSQLLSQRLQTTIGARTISSPLIDALADSTTVYLLTNFHIVTLSRSDAAAGRWLPKYDPIPGCTGFDQSCWRGAGFFFASDQLLVAQMRADLGAKVRVAYARELGAGPGTWNTAVSPLGNLEARRYVNILKTRSADDPLNATALVATGNLNSMLASGSQPSGITLDSNDYPVEAALTSSSSNVGLSGAISYRTRGTILYRGGVALCRAFGSAHALVAARSGGATTLTAIDGDGHKLSVSKHD